MADQRPEELRQASTEPGGPWEWCWLDDSPHGETYAVRNADGIVAYTSRYKRGYDEAKRIAEDHNREGQATSENDRAEGLRRADIDAMRVYWSSPTGVAQAPPGMVQYAQRCVDLLVVEVERLHGLVVDARDMFQRGDYDVNESQRQRLKEWMDGTNGDARIWPNEAP